MREPAKTIPTGVADFDSIIKGGFPAGSVILLVGDLGAGQTEFALTSAAKLAMVKERPDSAPFILGAGKDSRLPDKICYITFSRSREEVLAELEAAFNQDFYGAFERTVQFRDFSTAYFRKTLVPRSWTGESTSIFSSDGNNENVLEGLVNYLDEMAPNSMIIIDSLTDLVVSANIEIADLVAAFNETARQLALQHGDLHRTQYALGERIKELSCIYDVFRLTERDDTPLTTRSACPASRGSRRCRRPRARR